MVQATEKITPVTDDIQLKSPIQVLSFEELVDKFNSGEWDYCENHLYMRNLAAMTDEEQNKDVDDKIQALYFIDLEDPRDFDEPKDGKGYFEVLEPITLYFSERTNKPHVVNGNTRIKGLFKALRSDLDTFAGVPVHPIQYRIEYGLRDEDVERLQIKSNDTTKEHDILDIAQKAEQYKGKREKHWANQKKADGTKYNQQEIKKKSTVEAKSFYNIKSNTYFNHLRTLDKLPNWVKELIRKDTLSADAARTVYDAVKKLEKKKGNSEVSSTALQNAFAGIQAEVRYQGREVIKPKDIEEYFKKYATSGKEQTQPEPYSTVVSLKESNKIDDDSATAITSFLEDNKKVKEGAVITKLNSLLNEEKEEITKADVTQVLETFKPAESITTDSFLTRKTNLIDQIRKFNESYEVIIARSDVNKDLHEFEGDCYKFLATTQKFYKTSQSGETFKEVFLDLVINRIENIDIVLGDKVTESDNLYKLIGNMTEKINNIFTTLEPKTDSTITAEQSEEIVIEEEPDDELVVENEEGVATTEEIDDQELSDEEALNYM